MKATQKDKKDQSEKFIAKAKELGADESGEAFKRAIKGILRSKKHKQNQKLNK